MGDEREAADSSRPACPKCRYPDAARLAPSDALLRWQCRNHDCLYQWTTQRPGYRPAPAPVLDSRRLKQDEVVAMAKNDLTCGKCGREFVHPKRKLNHEADCEGSNGSQAPARRAARRSPPTAAPAAAAPAMGLIPIISSVPEHLVGSDLAPAMQRLIDRKRALDDERLQLDQALNALSRLQPVEAESRPT